MKLVRMHADPLFAVVVASGSLSVAAQHIKLGYNGDLSTSPSAQSGRPAVIGMEAAIAELNAAGGLLAAWLYLSNETTPLRRLSRFRICAI